MSDPRPIHEILDGVLQRFGVARPVESAALAADWDSLAGAPWAGRSRPTALSRGELVVEVADGAAASLLKYQTTELVGRLEAALGQGLVTSVRLRVGRSGRAR